MSFRLATDRRGAVAVLIGLSAPVLMMAVGLGVELSSWTVTQQELQRTADVAALAAAEAYYRDSWRRRRRERALMSLKLMTLQERRRGPGSQTDTLSDNMITIEKTAGPVNASDVAFLATIRGNVRLLLTRYALRPAQRPDDYRDRDGEVKATLSPASSRSVPVPPAYLDWWHQRHCRQLRRCLQRRRMVPAGRRS